METNDVEQRVAAMKGSELRDCLIALVTALHAGDAVGLVLREWGLERDDL